MVPVHEQLASRPGLAYELKHLNKHLPGTTESAKLIQKEGPPMSLPTKRPSAKSKPLFWNEGN